MEFLQIAQYIIPGIILFLLNFLMGLLFRFFFQNLPNPTRYLAQLIALSSIYLAGFIWLQDLGILALGILTAVGLLGLRLGYKLDLGGELNGKNFDFSLAGRLSLYNQRSVSKLVVLLSILSVGVGVAVMEISVSVVYGFKKDIQEKVVGFGSHIQVGNYLASFDSEINPIKKDTAFEKNVIKTPGVNSISSFLSLPAMIKSPETLEGIAFKGVNLEYDWAFFKEKLLRGAIPKLNNKKEVKEIIISEKLSRLLKVDTQDVVKIYFFRKKPKVRSVKISGIYKSGMEEFDAINIIGDIKLLRRVMRWDSSEIGGYEIKVNDLDSLHQVSNSLIEHLPLQLEATPIDEIFPEIFDWLELQHQNVWAILVLMIFIAIVNMTSVILILIIEQTQTIGLLKALGLNNFRIQKVFLFNSLILVLFGVFLGNFLGLGVLYLQEQFGFIALDQKSYFVEVVPVKWVWDQFIMINIGVVIVCTLCTYFPTLLISKISPVKAIRFS